MAIVCGAISPHGGLVVPEVYGRDTLRAPATRAGMEELGRRFAAARPDTIFLITPHGISIEDAFAVSGGEKAVGELGNTRQEFEIDQALARAIVATCRRDGVPAALVSTRMSSDPNYGSQMPLDWGAMIPLHFMGASWEPRPKVVIAGPSRRLTLQQQVEFGRAVAAAARDTGRRVGYIASTDQSHTHADGVYGYDAAAGPCDAFLRECLQSDDLLRLLDIDMDLVAHARPDGIWQMLTLAGAREVTPMRGEFLSYEVPSYFSMACVAYAPA